MTDEEYKQLNQLAKDLELIKSLQASDIYTPNYQEAMALFSIGYRKIPQNAVVITKEDYEILKNDYERGYYFGKMDALTAEPAYKAESDNTDCDNMNCEITVSECVHKEGGGRL